MICIIFQTFLYVYKYGSPLQRAVFVTKQMQQIKTDGVYSVH